MLHVLCKNSANGQLSFGYDRDNRISYSHYGNNLYYTDNGLKYNGIKTRIHTVRFEKDEIREYWLNGGDTPEATSAAGSSLTGGACTTGKIASNANFFKGDIGEFIIFTRALKTEERQDIEEYLAKKYHVELS